MEPVQLAKMARESLATALNAIQSCDDAPDELFDAAEPIAQTITILRKIERGGGAMLDGRDIALKNVRKILADVQNIEGGHPAADDVLEAVASSLAKVNALARWKGTGQPSVPPPAEAPAPVAAPKPAPVPVVAPKPTPAPLAAPKPTPAPVAAPKPALAPVAAPKPALAPVSAPRPEPTPAPAPRSVAVAVAHHFDEPRHVLDSRPTPAPQPVVQAKPVVFAQPAPDPAPQPVVQAKPIVVAQPEPVPAPQPVVQFAPVVVAQPEPIPALQPVVQLAPVVAVLPALAPVVALAPAAGAAAPESKAVPKKVAAPPAPPGVRTLDVSLGTRSVSNFYRGLGGNDVIEHGGVFVETYSIPKIGTQVQLHVHMPGDYEFYVLATVMWSRETGGSSEPGFGARITQIGNDGRQLVYRYSRIREPMFYDDL